MGLPFRTIVLSSVAAVVLAGCTVGPDFHRPATTMPSGWAPPLPGPATQPSETSAQPADLTRWWTQFNDDKLTSLVDRALKSNLTLQQAEARIRQARAQRGVDASAFWPDVSANAQYRRTRTPTPKAKSFGTEGGTQTDLYQTGFDATWELDVFGGTRRSVESADANIVAAVEDRRDTMVTLISEVAKNYLDLRGQQQRVDIAQRNLESQLGSVNVTRRKLEAGFVTGLDVANAEAQVASTRSLIPPLEAQIRQDIYAIALLLGVEPASLVQELTVTSPLPTTPPKVPVGLPSELLRRRPDIRRAEAQLHSATAQIGVATADLFPKFSLNGTLGIGGSELSSLSTLNNHNWSYGPSVTWDIFNAGRVQSSIKVQEALRDQSTLTYRQTVLTALSDVETALVAYTKEQEHRELLSQAVDSNRKAVDLSQLQYTGGETDFLNVLNAQRSLLAAEQALSSSTQDVATDLVSLYKALGGGWENPAPAPTTAPAIATTR